MNYKRPSLYVLPAIFVASLYGGYPILENILLEYGIKKAGLDFPVPTLFIVFNSFLLHFLLLTLASNEPVYKPWKAVLALNIGIVFPGTLAFIYSYGFIRGLMGSGYSSFYTYLAWLVLVSLLSWGCYRLLRSNVFSLFLGEDFGGWHIIFLIVTGMTVALHNIIIFYSIMFSI